MISLEQVSILSETKEQVIYAVNDVSLTINKEPFFRLFGYRGASKSTLVRTINLL
ncbi:hypothetical protein [Carnobacterium funditum]|uniref:hypothetical protein n=1 Tax=Carnobacterium funditum TaxID=2752 RepID=UPI000AFE7966|nr:hypothetical protein [Carnobacterium funditum]